MIDFLLMGLFFLVSAISLFIDQVSKTLIRLFLPRGEMIPPGGTFAIVHVTNKGGVFGLLPGWGLLFAMGGIAGVVLILIFAGFIKERTLRIALGLEMGGAMGNLMDRILFGEVLDFIKLGFWPVFNIADASITLGIVIIVLYLLRRGR